MGCRRPGQEEVVSSVNGHPYGHTQARARCSTAWEERHTAWFISNFQEPVNRPDLAALESYRPFDHTGQQEIQF